MTQPTKAIAPILLEDMRKVAVDRKGETNFFTSQMIKDCMKKVVPVGLHQGCWKLRRIQMGVMLLFNFNQVGSTIYRPVYLV